MVAIVVNEKTGASSKLSEVGKSVALGRDRKKCEITLPIDVQGVSRKHAVLTLQSETVVEITDTSTFGTTVRGNVITGTSTLLRDGETFTVGDFTFRISISASAPKSAAVRPKKKLETPNPCGLSSSRTCGTKNAFPCELPRPATSKKPVQPSERASSSQKKMHDFFGKKSSSSQMSVSSKSILANDTPSVLRGPRLGNMFSSSMALDSQLSDVFQNSAVGNENRPGPSVPRKKKGAPSDPYEMEFTDDEIEIISSSPSQPELEEIQQVPSPLASDTPFEQLGPFPKKARIEDIETVDDSQTNKPNSAQQSVRRDHDVVTGAPAPNADLDLNDVDSQFNVPPLAHSTQIEPGPPVRVAVKKIKESPLSSMMLPSRSERSHVEPEPPFRGLPVPISQIKGAASSRTQALNSSVNMPSTGTGIGTGSCTNKKKRSAFKTFPSSNVQLQIPNTFAPVAAISNPNPPPVVRIKSEVPDSVRQEFIAPIAEPPPKRRKDENLGILEEIQERSSFLDIDPPKPTRKTRNTRTKADQNPKIASDPEVVPWKNDSDISLMDAICSGKTYDDDFDDDEPLRFLGKPRKVEKNLDEDIAKVASVLKNMVSFVDLTRKLDDTKESGYYSYDKSVANKTGSTSGENFKRFKKAKQGRFNTTICTTGYVMGGSTDLVDFRKLR